MFSPRPLHSNNMILWVCVLTSCGQLNGDEIAVVYPEKYTSAEAPGGQGTVGRWEPGRLQTVYSAEEFSSQLPEGYRTIVGVRWRPDASVQRPVSVTSDHVRLRFSTTEGAPGDLSFRYEDNIGDDDTIVFDGPLTQSTENTGPEGGPKDFDVAIDFTNPFRYDPANGNLLIDFTWFGSFNSVGIDEYTDDDIDLCHWVGHIGDPMAEFAETEGFGCGVRQFVFASDPLPGDFNDDNILDSHDIDMLSEQVRTGSSDLNYDLDQNGQVDAADRGVWVHDLRNTYYGDADNNGQFNTQDLVSVLSAGEYEDTIAGNSTWATGDWNGDAEFTSGDLVLALADGGYEAGPRPAVVPEPMTLVLLLLGLTEFCKIARRVG